MIIYFSSIFVFILGLYVTISDDSYVRKIFGIIALQNSILIFYIAVGKFSNCTIPVVSSANVECYSNPLPQVLMLTAIVVGFSILALLLSLAKRIYMYFGSLDSTELNTLCNDLES